MIYMHFNEWAEQFQPVPNHLTQETDTIEFGITGIECDFVYEENLKNPNRIWTVVDDGENANIIPGMHRVNREAYIVTDVPWDDMMMEIDYN